jgi:hypothetical protein
LRSLAFVLAIAISGSRIVAQTTIATGSIQGTIKDESGAVIVTAIVTIRNPATRQQLQRVTNATGAYSSGALLPGEYTIQAEAPGFQSVERSVSVNVGVTVNGDLQLPVGIHSNTIEVPSSSFPVNTEQPVIQGVLHSEEIDDLPISGRDFLELAQLEPGAQVVDGATLDPTKTGFSTISFGGRSGRTVRLEVDGLDVSDETVGTTTQSIPLGAIEEFNISQSMLDLSTELTSSGAVNVVTRSGTNSYHGSGFYYFRDDATAARVAPNTPFQRHQYGGRFGGPFMRDRLFFFVSGERTKQSFHTPVTLVSPFADLSGGFDSPFRDKAAFARLDWQVRPTNYRFFYRFSYHNNKAVASIVPDTYQPFANRNNTAAHAIGLHFNTSTTTHAVRIGASKFVNYITDVPRGSLFDPSPGLAITIGASAACVPGLAVFCSGTNPLGPQATFQTNYQFKYDGTKSHGSHIFRFGVDVDRIGSGGFASFFGLAPLVGAILSPESLAFAAAGPFTGGVGNPLNYPVDILVLGNGQGFLSEIPAFDLPGGGAFDTRFAVYGGDSWKLLPNLTLTFGMRYVRDTGRTDSDLPPLPCSTLNHSTFSKMKCTGHLLDLFGPGLGDRIRQPNSNFAPQFGLVWSLDPEHRTAVRAGIGLFYENALFNVSSFDRPARLPAGLFFAATVPCPSGILLMPGGGVVDTSAVCGSRIGDASGQIIALQGQYQAATRTFGPQTNPAFVGQTLAAGPDASGALLFAPNYSTPRSIQMNVGVEREIARETILSVDYLRNVSLHYVLAIDTNHVGDSRFLGLDEARNAISLTAEQFGCGSGTNSATIECTLDAGANIHDFAINGLDSGNVFLSGLPAQALGFTPGTGAAFPGANPLLGQNYMLFPVGRAIYNGLQMRLRHTIPGPFAFVHALHLQASYVLSRYRSMTDRQDSLAVATNMRSVDTQFGPNGLDRTHQVAFGVMVDGPEHLHITCLSRFATAVPATLLLPASGGPGNIFTVDTDGDGTGAGISNLSQGDVLPGTNLGAFGRDVSSSDLNATIAAYNTTYAGRLTPAGMALVNARLFTADQLVRLGAVTPHLSPPPRGQVGLDSFRSFDLRVAWSRSLGQHLTVSPGVSFYNLFNFANFDAPRQTLRGVLDGQPGSINGTTRATRTNRIRPGSGVFWSGVPRVLEWEFKLTF